MWALQYSERRSAWQAKGMKINLIRSPISKNFQIIVMIAASSLAELGRIFSNSCVQKPARIVLLIDIITCAHPESLALFY